MELVVKKKKIQEINGQTAPLIEVALQGTQVGFFWKENFQSGFHDIMSYDKFDLCRNVWKL